MPEAILYDRMKTIWLNTDERGEVVWHPVFLDFAVTGNLRRACAGRIGRRRKGRSSPA